MGVRAALQSISNTRLRIWGSIPGTESMEGFKAEEWLDPYISGEGLYSVLARHLELFL